MAEATRPVKPRYEPAAVALPEAVGRDCGALRTICSGKFWRAGATRWPAVRGPPSGGGGIGGPGRGTDSLRARGGTPPGRPPLMAILKPCLGLSPDEIADLFGA